MIVFYYLGSFLMPIALWISLFWVIKKYAFLEKIYRSDKKSLFVMLIIWLIRKIKFFDKYFYEKLKWRNFSFSQKIKFVLLFIALLFMFELFWRLIFEYLIAFMQMHEALST